MSAETMELDTVPCSSPKKVIKYASYTGSTKTKTSPQSKHRALYKTPPNWLKSYRERCLSELNSRRRERKARLIDSFCKTAIMNENNKDRIIREVMASVWKNFDFTINQEEYQEDYREYLSSLQKELLLSDESEAFLCAEDESLEWTIANQHAVTCFACQSNLFTVSPVQDNSTKVECNRCHFCMVIKTTITEEYLADKFQQVVDMHSSRCDRVFEFQPVMAFSGAFLAHNALFFCKHCNFYQELL